jgi:PDZ domain/Outer membrane protein beta-barrel domain
MQTFARVLGSLSFAVASMFLINPSAYAQDRPKIDVFGGYSYLSVDTNGLISRQSANGWEASVSGNFNRRFALEGDVSGYYKTFSVLGVGDVKVHDYGFVGGPRINLGPAFVHALIGGDHATGSALGGSVSQDSFAGAFGGGVQIPVAPRWAVRASADYVLTRHNIFKLLYPLLPDYTQNNFRVSAGVVFSFGGTHEAHSQVSGSSPRHISGSEDAILFGITGYSRGDGVVVVSVHDPSPAAVAGIEPGDVIMRIDAQPVHDSRDIESAVATSKTGTVRVMYFRRGVLQIEKDIKIR